MNVLCPQCEKIVLDYEPGVSSVTVDGLLMHPACVPPHPSERQEWMRRSQDMLLTLGITEDLTDDAIDGYEIGLTAEQFVAAMIVLPRKSA